MGWDEIYADATGDARKHPVVDAVIRGINIRRYGVPSAPTRLAVAIRHELGRFRAQAVSRGVAR